MNSSDNVPKEFEGRLSQGKDWRDVVAWVGDLPPMPHVAAKAIQMVEKPDTTAKELTDVLSKDAALAARVLKIANSALFCRQREISTLNQAIMVIGFKALKGIVVAATVRQMAKSFGNVEKLIWENSMCTAMCASVLAQKLGKRYVEEIFLLGLLHSLGQVVLVTGEHTRKSYPDVLKIIETDHIDFVTAEQNTYGFAHPLIGALVAKKWNFSPETCQVILHYADPIETRSNAEESEVKTAIVQLADLITHAADVGNPNGYPGQQEQIASLARFVKFKEDTLESDMEKIVEEVKAQFEREKHVYE